MALLLAIALVVGPAQSIGAATSKRVSPEAAAKARLHVVREKIASRVTQDEREAAAARLKLKQDLADLKGVKPAMAMPGPGDTPDYFGMTPNWAYSPLLKKFIQPLP